MMGEVTFEWELFCNDNFEAGGTAPDMETAEIEGKRYLAQYAGNGGCTLTIYRKTILGVYVSK